MYRKYIICKICNKGSERIKKKIIFAVIIVILLFSIVIFAMIQNMMRVKSDKLENAIVRYFYANKNIETELENVDEAGNDMEYSKMVA